MKNKLFISFLAFMLSVCAADAQRTSFQSIGKAKTITVQKRGGPSDLHGSGIRKAPAKIVLPENQTILGLYDGDEVASSGVGFPEYPGQLLAASYIPVSSIPFADGNVVAVRYGLAQAATVSGVFMYGVDSNGSINLLFEEAVTADTSPAGWSTVELSSPCALDFSGYEALLLGFAYAQTDTGDESSYPLSFMGDGSQTFVYGDLGSGEGWYTWNTTSLGSLCVQAIVADAEEVEGVEINEENFPDETFRNFVSNIYDTNGDGKLSTEERAKANRIYISNTNITTLKGIEHFYALTELSVDNCGLTSLDISKNTALQNLYCSDNSLIALDLSNNTNLQWLYCSYNSLTSLDISKNTALQILYCRNNSLIAIDLR